MDTVLYSTLARSQVWLRVRLPRCELSYPAVRFVRSSRNGRNQALVEPLSREFSVDSLSKAVFSRNSIRERESVRPAPCFRVRVQSLEVLTRSEIVPVRVFVALVRAVIISSS